MAVNLYEQHRPREATITVSASPDFSGDFVCDGTNDELDLLAAEAYIAAVGGKIVLLAGTYTLGAAIVLTIDGITWSGMGQSTIVQSTGNWNAFTITSIDNIVIENMCIRTTSDANVVYCIFAEDGCENLVIRNNYFDDSDEDAIHLEGTGGTVNWMAQIHGNYFTATHIDANPIEVAPDNLNIITTIIAENVFYDAQAAAIRIDRGNASIISENIFYSCATNNVYVSLSPYVAINDNTFDTSAGNGIFLYDGSDGSVVEGNTIFTAGGVGVLAELCDSVNIVDNNVYDPTGNGIEFDDSDFGQAEGNLIYSSAATGIMWAATTAARSTFTCVGNTIIQAAGAQGILIDGNMDNGCLVQANNVYDSTGYGIHIDVPYAHVVGNYTYSSGAAQIFLSEDNAFVIANYIYDGADDGLSGDGAGDNCHIHGNYIVSNGAYGLDLVNGMANCNITGNYWAANTSGDFRDGAPPTSNVVMEEYELSLIGGTTLLSAAAGPMGYEIDAGGEFVVGTGHIPGYFAEVHYIIVEAVGLAAPGAGNTMLIDMDAHGAAPDEVYTTEDIAVAAKVSNEINFGVNDVISWVFYSADDIDITHLLGGDRIEVRLLHNAGVATNIATDAVISSIRVVGV